MFHSNEEMLSFGNSWWCSFSWTLFVWLSAWFCNLLFTSPNHFVILNTLKLQCFLSVMKRYELCIVSIMNPLLVGCNEPAKDYKGLYYGAYLTNPGSLFVTWLHWTNMVMHKHVTKVVINFLSQPRLSQTSDVRSHVKRAALCIWPIANMDKLPLNMRLGVC